MSIVERHEPGTFSWVELATTDPAAAREFYTALFGWGVNEVPMGDGSFYYRFRHRDQDAAAMYGLSAQMREQGVPPHWMSYVTVANVDESAARVRELGGTVVAEPSDVFDIGRMAVAQDPTGAPFSLWEARGHIGSGIVGEPGAFCWNELATGDTARAAEFYTALFGWGTHEMDTGGMTYTVFMSGDRQVGGMYALTPEMAGVPPHWMVYFAVEDCDADTTRARELGAAVHQDPMDVPGVGRMSVLQDPQGASFSIIRLAPADAATSVEGEPIPA